MRPKNSFNAGTLAFCACIKHNTTRALSRRSHSLAKRFQTSHQRRCSLQVCCEAKISGKLLRLCLVHCTAYLPRLWELELSRPQGMEHLHVCVGHAAADEVSFALFIRAQCCTGAHSASMRTPIGDCSGLNTQIHAPRSKYSNQPLQRPSGSVNRAMATAASSFWEWYDLPWSTAREVSMQATVGPNSDTELTRHFSLKRTVGGS